MVEHAVPILPSRDLRESLELFRRLGFVNLGAEPEEWDDLILGRGGMMLHVVAAPDVDLRATACSCFLDVARWTPRTGCASSRSSTRAGTSCGSAPRGRSSAH